MEKSVLVVTDVEESGVESRHDFLHLSHVKVSYSIRNVAALLLQRHQAGILKQGNRHFLVIDVYY